MIAQVVPGCDKAPPSPPLSPLPNQKLRRSASPER